MTYNNGGQKYLYFLLFCRQSIEDYMVISSIIKTIVVDSTSGAAESQLEFKLDQ